MKTLHILSLKKPLPSTLHTISKSVYKSISVVVLLMTAFTVVLAPSGVHADKPTLQTIKVLTTDASGNSAPPDDLRLGDKIRIVIRASVTANGPPRIIQVGALTALTLSVDGINSETEALPLVHPTAIGNLVDFDGLPSADKDDNPNTGDVVFGYTIRATDKIPTGLTLYQTNLGGPISIPSIIKDAGNLGTSSDKAPFRSPSVEAALLAIRADGSRVVDPAARIEVSDHDPEARTYSVTVTLTPPPGRTVANFGFSGLTIQDATSADADVSLVAGSFSNNVYKAVIKYAESNTLPLKITIKQGVFSTSNPDLFGTLIAPPHLKKLYRYECPVGWVRADWVRVGGASGRTRRALLYEVNLEMDLHHPISIYKPTSVAIYVHPDEGLENLHGWKLQVATPYNHHRAYLLTAENSVVVASKVEGIAGGFAFIKSPEADPFPMVEMGFTGRLVPGFDYRLYDDTGKRVDFGIACYKRSDIFQMLKAMEVPSVLRQIDLETLDWDVSYLRSEWTVPVPVNVPGAPSLQGANLVGKWADLKKQ